MRNGVRPLHASAGQETGGFASLVCLLLLVSADAAFVAAHVIARLYSAEPSLYNLGRDGGYAEMFQYLKTYGVGFALAALWSRTRQHVFGAWMLLFLYVLCDDALQIHERGAKLVSAALGYGPALGLRAQDLGELTVWGFFGLAFLALIACAHLRSARDARTASLGIAQLFCVLAFFGAAVDMLHSAASNPLLRAALTIVEDGGEMLAMSLIAWYVAKLLEGGRASLPVQLGRFTPR